MTWTKVSDTLLLERDRQRRQQLLDRIVAAPGKDARRSEAIDVMAAEGNFLVRAGGHTMTVARLTKWLTEQLPAVAPGDVTPC